jgi:hypothetical protein
MSWNSRASLACVCVVGLVVDAAVSVAQQPALPGVLRESIAGYAKLTSYADAGTVRQEVPGIIEESKFTTHFRRATRDLYFDFQTLTSRDPKTGFTIDLSANRTVIWMFNGNMQTYNFTTRTHQQVAAQAQALQRPAHATRGTSMLIPSLLYSQAGLPGTVVQIEDAQVAGIEEINQHRCHKVVGTAVAYYRSGARTGERPVTVWIDVETHLIRRVVEDTPKSQTLGFSRLTVTLEPRANPAIEDARFQFTPPAP